MESRAVLRRTFLDPDRPWAWVAIVVGGAALFFLAKPPKLRCDTCAHPDGTWVASYSLADPRREDLKSTEPPDRAHHDADDRREWAKSLFDERLSEYHEDLGKLADNLKLQLVVLLAAVLALRRSFAREAFKLPFVDVEVPTRWAYLFIPIAAVYLWLSCGFQLDHLIQERVFLWKVLDQIEVAIPNHHPSVLSYRLLLEDRSFMDVWFAWFEPGCFASPERAVGLEVTLLVGWMGFHGLLHGAALALLSLPRRRFAAQRWIRMPVLLLALLLLVGSQVMFFQGYPTWCSVPVLGAMVVGLWGFRRWQLARPATVEEPVVRAAAE